MKEYSSSVITLREEMNIMSTLNSQMLNKRKLHIFKIFMQQKYKDK